MVELHFILAIPLIVRIVSFFSITEMLQIVDQFKKHQIQQNVPIPVAQLLGKYFIKFALDLSAFNNYYTYVLLHGNILKSWPKQPQSSLFPTWYCDNIYLLNGTGPVRSDFVLFPGNPDFSCLFESETEFNSELSSEQWYSCEYNSQTGSIMLIALGK
jgi:hypothetical protein